MRGVVRDWAFVERVAAPALALAPRDYLDNIRANVAANDIPDAVAEHDTPWIVNWLVGVSQYQGISDANAAAYTAKHGLVSSDEIASPHCKPDLPPLAKLLALSGLPVSESQAHLRGTRAPRLVPTPDPPRAQGRADRGCLLTGAVRA